MSAPLRGFGKVLKWIWSQTSALVAVVLIVGALWLGYRIGQPQHEEVEENGAETAVHTEHADDGGQNQGQAEAEGEPQMYTCSMHPSVRLPDPDAKCPICFMDLIPVREGAVGGSVDQINIPEAAAIALIETTPVQRFFPSAEVRLYGKVTYDETSVARITAYFPGRIDRLFVDYIGVSVNKGDHLAEMYSPELLAAFEELRQARLAVDQSQGGSELVSRMTEQTLVGAREKLRLFGLTDEQIAQAESGQSQGDHLTVYSPISGVVTMLASREGDYVQTGSPIVMVADLSRLWVDLEAYESQLPLLRWGQSVKFTVEAHPGHVYEGMISFIEPIVDQKTRTAAVRVAVDNSNGELKPGMFATAVVMPKVDTDGAIGSDTLAGKWVGPMHPTIVHDEPGQCEICGMDLVPAEELGAVARPEDHLPPLVIPRSSVIFTGTRSIVYVQVPDQDMPTYQIREIELGPRAGEFYTVRTGLKEGERVVVKGLFRIDSSMQIAGKASSMSPEGGGMSGHQHGGMKMDGPAASMDMGMAQSLSPLFEAYLKAQESLASDDLEAFNEVSPLLTRAVQEITPKGLVGDDLNLIRKNIAALKQPRAAETIEEARIEFAKWSQCVIALDRQFGHQGQALQVVHCPMAFDFEGADWIQMGEDIRNPYFGSQMLKCGSITETIEGKGVDDE